MKKCLFLTLLFLVFFPNKVKAECSDTEIIRLQKLARNVNVAYMYNKKNNTFIATFTNLKKDLVVYDADHEKSYNVTGELSFSNLFSGRHAYIIFAKNQTCFEDELITKYVDLPFYNHYYNLEDCKGIEDYSYCNKWIKNRLSYDIWKNKIKDYKSRIKNTIEKKKKSTNYLFEIYELISKYYMEYYYIILPAIIILFGIIILIKNRKDSLV